MLSKQPIGDMWSLPDNDPHSQHYGESLDFDFSYIHILVKFYVNNIESQRCFDRLLEYQGRFLEIYNYPKQQDSMSALHAKVISVDRSETLITSANLSYHGQEGNVELGTHVISKDIAMQVERVFTQLVFSKTFEKIQRLNDH